MSYQPVLKDFAEAGIRRSFCKFHGLFLRVCVQSASGTLFDTSKVVHRPLYFPFTWYAMLPIATTSELVSSSRSIFCRGATSARASATPKVQVRIRTLHQDSRSCSSTGSFAFAYLSKKRSQPVVTVAINMSTLSRRNSSSTSPSSSADSKQPTKTDSHSHSHADKHDHIHAHDNGHDHDHDHSHGGIFHSHAHDHSEGAEQIMKALTKGQLDRGTRITLLGQSTDAYRLV
jgi:hypothetical protein